MMLVRNTPKTRKEQRRIRQRRALQEFRAREAQGLAMYPVIIDGDVINFAVRLGYLTESDVTNKAAVSKALSQILMEAIKD
jgi:hypothetical protein